VLETLKPTVKLYWAYKSLIQFYLNIFFSKFDVFLTLHHSIDWFQVTKLMQTSFILQQYICYIIILNVFQAILCSSSGGQILLLQHLVSSLSVNGRTVRRLKAYCTAVYREWRYQML